LIFDKITKISYTYFIAIKVLYIEVGMLPCSPDILVMLAILAGGILGIIVAWIIDGLEIF